MKSYMLVIRVDNLPDAYSHKNVRAQVMSGIAASNVLNPENLTIYVVEEVRPLPDLESKEPLSAQDAESLANLLESLELRRNSFNQMAARITRRLMAS